MPLNTPPMTHEMLLSPANALALLAAVSLGGSVGLVRQWDEHEKAVAGLRTFALWSMIGFVAAQLERTALAGAFLTGFVALTALLAAFSFRPETRDGFGLTTMSAALATYLCGVLLGLGLTRYAVVLAVLVAGIIGIRTLTAAWSAKLNETDVRAGLMFAFLTGVILPLVPDETLWGVFNPYHTWLMVLVISGVNLTGYIAIRLLGDRAGAAITGLFGGLASSTAVTISFARRSHEQPEHGTACAQAVLLASAVMVPRVMVMLAMIAPEFAIAMIPAALGIGAVSLAGPLWLHFRRENAVEEQVPEVSNPLGMMQALRFGAFYAFINFLLAHYSGRAGTTGLYSLGFVAGLNDMGAISLSAANRVVTGQLVISTAAAVVLVAMFSNTLVKLLLAVATGGGRFRSDVALLARRDPRGHPRRGGAGIVPAALGACAKPEDRDAGLDSPENPSPTGFARDPGRVLAILSRFQVLTPEGSNGSLCSF